MMIPPLVGNLPCLKDLMAVLFECFLIISLGYLSCRFKLISARAKDLNSYLTTFALPMIIFLNIAQMEFQTINLSFLFCMLTAKLLVFIIVTLLTLIISYPTNFGYAGALSILATQSNDFALGYPLIKSLYGDSRSEMLNYLSLMAPIQLLILNPLGIVMLEYEKSRRSSQPESRDEEEEEDEEGDSSLLSSSESCECRCKSNRRRRERNNNNRKPLEEVSFANCNLELENSRARGIEGNQIRRRTSVGDDSQTRVASKINRNIKSLKLVMPAPAGSLENILQVGGESETNQNNSCSTCVRSPASGPSSPVSSLPAGRRQSKCSSPGAQISNPTKSSSSPVNLNFLYALATNPLIIASVVALSVNLIHGPELPKLVTKVSNTIAASFAAPALFVVGSSMAGKFQLLMRNPNDLVLSSALVLTKLLLLPSLMRTLASIILPAHTPADEIPFLIDFSFLYGLLPTAPTACIIAKQYGVLTNVVAISMILSTFLSAPLTLAASVIINPGFVVKLEEIQGLMSQTLKLSSLLTLVLASLVLYAFWRSKQRLSYTKFINLPLEVVTCKIKTNPTHVFLFLLAATQILIGLAGAGWFFVDTNSAVEPAQKFARINFTSITGETGSALAEGDLEDNDDMNSPDEPDLAGGLQGASQVRMERLGSTSGSDALTCLQYVLASSSILLARLVILCILLTTAAIRLRGYTMASKVSSILVKVFLAIGVTLILWLAFDAQQLPLEQLHFPMESTIPSSKRSLYVRLIYDTLFMALSVPLFALIIRSDNRSKRLLETLKLSTSDVFVVDSQVSLSQSSSADEADLSQRGSQPANGGGGGELVPVVSEAGCSHQAPAGSGQRGLMAGFKARNFITSNSSLSSETSSAMTTNTSFESSPLQDVNNNTNFNSPTISSRQLHSDSISVNLIDGVNFMPTISRKTLNSFMTTTTNSNNQQQNQTPPTSQNCGEIVDNYEALQLSRQRANSSPELKRKSLIGLIQMSEFNKYSILILFMLITTTLNLTSIIQKLVQEKPFGTFRQIEVMSVAMDFGQGLLTFLVYGFRGLTN